MGGLWRKRGVKGGKYLVTRRDGTVPGWQWFVIGERDPAAPAALRAYADEAERLGMDPDYVSDIREMASEWLDSPANGDPDAPPHRRDNKRIAELMAKLDRSA